MVRLFGLPVLLAVTWLGMKIYGRLDEAKLSEIMLPRRHFDTSINAFSAFALARDPKFLARHHKTC